MYEVLKQLKKKSNNVRGKFFKKAKKKNGPTQNCFFF